MSTAPQVAQINELLQRIDQIKGGGKVICADGTTSGGDSAIRQLTMDSFLLITSIIKESKHPLVERAESYQRAYKQPNLLPDLGDALLSLRRSLENGNILPYKQLSSGLQPLNIAQSVVIIKHIATRFHDVVINMRRRYGDRAPFNVKDEYDVQDLLRSLLLIHFTDIRSEEWVPSTGSAKARCDLVLKQQQIFIETKMTRESLTEKKLIEELSHDIVLYPSHTDCKCLVVFIHDPEGWIGNPAGLRDIEKRGSIPVHIVLTQGR